MDIFDIYDKLKLKLRYLGSRNKAMGLLVKFLIKVELVLKIYHYEIMRKVFDIINKINGIDKSKMEFILEEYRKSTLKDKTFYFVQIGANDGVKFDDLYDFTSTHKCKGIVVEPIKRYFKELEKHYANYPDIIPLNYAIHGTDKTAIIHHVDPAKLPLLEDWARGVGSLFRDVHKRDHIPSEYMITEEVKCIHFMDLIKEHNLDEINLLQTDTQGYDGQIIKMIDFERIKPKLIVYESNFLARKERQEVRALLKKQGYKLKNSLDHPMDTIAILST